LVGGGGGGGASGARGGGTPNRGGGGRLVFDPAETHPPLVDRGGFFSIFHFPSGFDFPTQNGVTEKPGGFFSLSHTSLDCFFSFQNMGGRWGVKRLPGEKPGGGLSLLGFNHFLWGGPTGQAIFGKTRPFCPTPGKKGKKINRLYWRLLFCFSSAPGGRDRAGAVFFTIVDQGFPGQSTRNSG